MGIDDGHQNDAHNAAEPHRPTARRASLRGRVRVMGRWLRERSTHVLVVALVAAIVPVFLTRGLDWISSEPAPKCPGPACDGKNADTYGCPADAQTEEPSADTYNPVHLQVRYSEYCGAVWGRILAGEPGDQLTLKVRGGSAQVTKVDYGHDKPTTMAWVGKAFHVEVCAVPTTAKRTGDWHAYCITATDADFEAAA